MGNNLDNLEGSFLEKEGQHGQEIRRWVPNSLE